MVEFQENNTEARKNLTKGEKYLNAFMDEIRSLGISVNLVGEERYNLCNTNLAIEK